MNDKRNALGKVASIIIILAIVVAMPVSQAYATLEVVRRPILYAKDANSHVAVQGASVYLDGVSMGTTDSSGALTLVGAYAGLHQLSVHKEGYITHQTTIPIASSNNTLIAYLTAAPSATLVYSTDFEDVTKRDANELNMGIDNWFEFGGDGGAAMWMEGLDRNTPNISCHSGNRCVGMELTDIAKSRRSMFNIYLQNLIQGDELFVSVWLYLPPDWQLHLPSGYTYRNWYEIADPYFTGPPAYQPYSAITIYQKDSAVQVFDLAFELRDASGAFHTLKQIPDYPVPRGRWFNLQYYVYRHETNGIVRAWIDGALLFDGRNIPTKNASILEWKTIPAKIYYDTNDRFSPYRIWVDDLEIYEG